MLKLRSSHLSLGLCAALAGGVAGVSATGVVVLYPATLTVNLSLPSETVTHITAYAYPPSGSAIQKSVSTSGAGPHTLDLVVDGGNPSNSGDPGVAYTTTLSVSIAHPGSSSSVQISRNQTVVLDNTAATPSAEAVASFSYPTLHHANAAVTVIGGTLSSYNFQVSGSASAVNEYYSSSTSGNGNGQTSATNWVPVIPTPSASISGYAYVTAANGTSSQRYLGSQTLDLIGGNSWTVDLTSTGVLEGQVLLSAASGSSATVTSHRLYYQGTSASSSGISGSVLIGAAQTDYQVELTPGNYQIYLQTYFSNPSQQVQSKYVTVTVTAGATTTRSFDDAFGVARLDLDVKGFYSNSSLQSVSSYLRAPDYSQYAYNYQVGPTGFESTVPVGAWQSYYTYLNIYDASNPELPVNSQLYRYHYDDADAPAATVSTTGVAGLGTEVFTLVKSNVYLDVVEPAGQPEQLISSPQIYAYKYDYNPAPNATLRRQSSVYSYGSGQARPRAGLTMVAEPGTYALDARAYVGGTLTTFAGSSITFGQPRDTHAGTNVETVLTPPENPALRVTLMFPSVAAPGGLSTVVESPLGPAPPEGFSTVCTRNAVGVSCDPIYYDISTTAVFTPKAKVCIRRQMSGVSNAAADFLRLFHYTGAGWEILPPPPGGRTAFDCSEDPAQCGCADEASCGIDTSADPVKNVFLVCGMTTSFSPFAIFKETVRFTNVVDGVEYTGPTGPPALQEWVVPADGVYRITAVGAEGAAATGATGRKGGCGAETTGDFALHGGDVVQILVGQKGTATADSAGGGGGSFVTVAGWASPLAVAGGGGGVRSGALVDGRHGGVDVTGVPGSIDAAYAASFVNGGSNGGGGGRRAGFGAGGGGWSGSGASDGAYGEGGFSFRSGKRGQGGLGKTCGGLAHGGYGGGGAGNGCSGAGGGGGYAGGGGGAVAGGGGSANWGENATAVSGRCTSSGHGYVMIDLVGP